MVSALSSPSLPIGYRFGFFNKQCFFPSLKISSSLEETISDLTENQKQDTRTMRRTTKVSKDEIPISNLQTPVKDMAPPLVRALKASVEKDVACFHFPGHNRGRAAPSSLTRLIGGAPFFHDLPELPELDDLFSPKGAILDAQNQAAKLFGSTETWFLVGGTTCGVQAAIMATCSPGDLLILPRNSHISAVSAMVLSGALPKYIIPEYISEWDISGAVTALQVEKAIKELEMEGCQAAAVFVTSPTYNGICSDLCKISKLCHSHGIPLIVDEAHGAHFGFHRDLPNSALAQGADLAVQSTHKVLSSLTQSSMLHMSGSIVDRKKICRCLQVLQTTSPSYLLLASLDAARAQLEDNPGTTFDEAMALAVNTANLIRKIPNISLLEFPLFYAAVDPLRVTVGVWKLGLSGYEADNILYDEYGIIPELVGTRSLTFAINLGTCRKHAQRLVSGLEHLSATSIKNNSRGREEKVEDDGDCVPFGDISISLMSPREAFFASKRTVRIEESLGEICGELICPYPPGIPVLSPGEIITENAVNYLVKVKHDGAAISGASDPSLSTIVVCKEGHE